MLNKGDSDRVSTDVIDRPALGKLKTVGEQGSSRRLSSFIPNSCLGLKPASHKAGRRKTMSETSINVGIDVSKDSLDVALSSGERFSMTNDEHGISGLAKRL